MDAQIDVNNPALTEVLLPTEKPLTGDAFYLDALGMSDKAKVRNTCHTAFQDRKCIKGCITSVPVGSCNQKNCPHCMDYLYASAIDRYEWVKLIGPFVTIEVTSFDGIAMTHGDGLESGDGFSAEVHRFIWETNRELIWKWITDSAVALAELQATDPDGSLQTYITVDDLGRPVTRIIWTGAWRSNAEYKRIFGQRAFVEVDTHSAANYQGRFAWLVKPVVHEDSETRAGLDYALEGVHQLRSTGVFRRSREDKENAEHLFTEKPTTVNKSPGHKCPKCGSPIVAVSQIRQKGDVSPPIWTPC